MKTSLAINFLLLICSTSFCQEDTSHQVSLRDLMAKVKSDGEKMKAEAQVLNTGQTYFLKAKEAQYFGIVKGYDIAKVDEYKGGEKFITAGQNADGDSIYLKFSNHERFLVSKEDIEEFFYSESDMQAIVKKYGLAAWKNVVKAIVIIGWNKDLCKLSWGEPEDVNKTTTGYGTREQWVYGSKSYLYFINGKLTTIQN